MKPNRLFLTLPACLLSLTLLPPVRTLAQETGEGINRGNYNVKQSVELGYRWTDFAGNPAVFDTFVNLHQGPRLFDYTLQMRSLDHKGLLFDDLFLTSFGYGGDPNDFSLLRVSKNKWYNFNGSFRRDRNLWDYNLLANPLNPTNSTPYVPLTYSPHLMRLSRRMSDFNLTLLPQSPVRFRLGYARNINEGPSLTTYHEGTDIQLLQDWKTTWNSYQIGVDFKLLRKTNISYDQFLQYYKGDTSWVEQNFAYELSSGTPVDLGIIFNTTAAQPCAAPLTSTATTPPTANPQCNGALAYARSGPVRSFYPVEQLSLQSSAIKNLDVAGRLVYSSAKNDVAMFQEFFQGLVTRTNQGQFATGGAAAAKRVSTTADLAATYSVTPKFRLVDEFRFYTWRMPGQWASRTSSLFGTSMLLPPAGFDPATCPAPYTAATCPPHNTSSPADWAATVSSLFFAQDTKFNTFQVEYDFTRRFGGRLGYRYRHRTITQHDTELADELYYPPNAQRGDCADPTAEGVTLNPDGSCQFSGASSDSENTVINEHSLLVGLWARPVDALRVTSDVELMSADRAFTRVSPRQFQHYKLRANYKPRAWMSLAGFFNIYEARNNVSEVKRLQHSRSYGLNASFAPKERFALDLGYDYNNVFSHTNICFIFGFGPPPPGFPPCTVVDSPVPLKALSIYSSTTNFGYADLMVKPLKRLTLNLGYALTSVTGNTLILNPSAPPGPLQFNYHKPYASLAIELHKGLSWKGSWAFYDYDEKGERSDPTGARSFRGNLLNLTFRYAF
jgi:hypothetical protein